MCMVSVLQDTAEHILTEFLDWTPKLGPKDLDLIPHLIFFPRGYSARVWMAIG